MRKRLPVYLTQTEQMALFELAERERRDPREEAALLIRRGLEDARLLPATEFPKQAQTAAQPAEQGGAHD